MQENNNKSVTENILLSIALMVSNRKDTIQKCLDSLTPIREQLPCELIILDTGCDKELRTVLEEYGDVVKSFTWCNDFSKARNETLKLASGEWYLYLDDDEWFVDTAEIIAFFKSGEYRNYNYASYIQRNFLDMEASQYSDAWVSRMIKKTKETHFESKIHEYLAPLNGNCKGLHSVVHHFGYVYETEEALQRHYDRNRTLLEEMIVEEPENLRWRIHLAQEFRSMKELDKLYQLGEECLALVKDRDEMYDNISLGAFYGAKILVHKERKEYQKGIFECEKALADKRNTKLFLAFCALQLTGFYYWSGNYEKTVFWGLEYLTLYDFFQKNEPVWFIQKHVPFIGECFDKVMIKEVYSELICTGLKQGNHVPLNQYLNQLEWGSGHIYVFEDMIPVLIAAMNDSCGNARQNGVIGWNGLTKQKIADFEPVLKVMYENSALWEYFCNEICQREQEGHDMGPIMALIKQVLPEAVGEPTEKVSPMTPEMEALATQVKSQLTLLLENGMVEQAKEIIAQVRKILPADEELKEMEEQLSSL